MVALESVLSLIAAVILLMRMALRTVAGDGRSNDGTRSDTIVRTPLTKQIIA